MLDLDLFSIVPAFLSQNNLEKLDLSQLQSQNYSLFDHK